MANPEHVELVMQGHKILNQWRKDNPEEILDLSYKTFPDFTFRHLNLSHADLTGAGLGKTDLSFSNFNFADLTGASFRFAALCHTNFSQTNLMEADFTAADLSYANLSLAMLKEANLYRTNLSYANLDGAYLEMAKAVEANFTKSTFTDACIKNWLISGDTNLEDIVCDCIYLDFDHHKNRYSERRPSTGSFARGDFTKLMQKSLNTVDLIFRNGINWEAFAHSFKKLQVQTGSDELDIQAIENKGNGDFVIRVNTPKNANKGKIQEFVMEEYGKELKAIETQYQAKLELKGEQVEFYREQLTIQRQDNTRLIGVVEKMAEQESAKYDLRGAKFDGGFADTVQGDQIGTQHNYAPEKQDLAEAAAAIQQLLKQLEENNPTATDIEKRTFISMGIGPTKKQRLINAVKSGGKAAIEEFLDNPYLNVAIAIIEGWKENEG